MLVGLDKCSGHGGVLQKVALAPYDAMYGLAGCASDGADWERFRRIFRATIVTGSHTLLDHLDLAIEARSATLNQRNIGRKAHLVHMPPCIHVVQCIEHDIVAPEPRDIELRLLNVRMMRLDLDFWVEPLRSFLGHLCLVSLRLYSCTLLLPDCVPMLLTF